MNEFTVPSILVERTADGCAWRCLACQTREVIPFSFEARFGVGSAEVQAAFVGRLHSYSHEAA